jgi:ribosomal protein S12 methylthiotransferase accessory factor
MELGPSDPLRSIAASSLLPRARAAADDAGVTRLAEITRLDRLGLPIWQAVRPMSRALSVHQGKGATDAEAQIGALLEAVESHHAEQFAAEGISCRFDQLPPGEASPTITDFAADRARPPNGEKEHRWVPAEDLLTGGTLYLPFDVVSLDFTRCVPSLFDRASNGVATAASKEEAIAVALQEFIERDAVTEWQAGGLLACTAGTLQIDSVPFAWFRHWVERLNEEAIAIRFFHVPSVTASPVFICELNDGGKEAAPYRINQGRGCHPVPELALFKALAEALQARATYIAGARDDLFPDDYRAATRGVVRLGFGLPLAVGMAGVHWNEIQPGPAGSAAIAAALDRVGYSRIAVVELARVHGLSIVRAFVCGLGSLERRRRAPQ